MSTFECSMCKKKWNDLASFLNDENLIFHGYQALPSNPIKGLFMFTHTISSCGTSIAMEVDSFKSLLPDGLEIKPFEKGTAHDCKGYCRHIDNLEACVSENCNGRIIRDLMQIIRKRMNNIIY